MIPRRDPAGAFPLAVAEVAPIGALVETNGRLEEDFAASCLIGCDPGAKACVAAGRADAVSVCGSFGAAGG